MIKFETAEVTDKGIREMNQDYHLIFKNVHGNLFVIVADGMGGHVGGQVASKFAVKVIKKYFETLDLGELKDEEILHQLEKSVQFLTIEFKKIGERNPEFADMGTTLNMNVFVGDNLFTVNVGDSRSQKIEKNNFEQISEDHNLAQLAKVDKRFEKFAGNANMLTSSLGPRKETKIDVFKNQIKKSGYLLVTSDGIHQYVSKDFMVKTINKKNKTLEEKLEDIKFEAIKNMTNDNMTILGVKYDV